MNLDVSNWKYFDFIRIFDIKKGFYNKKPESLGKGNIPFLGAVDNNNGITGYYTLEEIESSSKTGKLPNHNLEEKLFPGRAVCVTNNGSVGCAYYQANQFTCSHDVNLLYKIDGDFNEYTGLFIATVIMNDRYRWGYGRKWRPSRMIKSKIKLPIKKMPNGIPCLDDDKKYSDEGYIPDWDFMEKYILSMKCTPVKTQNNQKKKVVLPPIKNWGKFKLGDLFEEMYKSPAYVKAEFEVSKTLENNMLRFISRTEKNNGCDCYVLQDEDMKIEEPNAIIIGDTTATIFYQEQQFITGDHIVVCRANWINKYTGLFVKTIIEKERYRYNYGRAFKMDLIKSTEILLPKTESDKPDWTLIENYIKSFPYGDRI